METIKDLKFLLAKEACIVHIKGTKDSLCITLIAYSLAPGKESSHAEPVNFVQVECVRSDFHCRETTKQELCEIAEYANLRNHDTLWS
jgi:hypothetical protein